SLGVEFGDATELTPTHERISVVERLRVPLGGDREGPGVCDRLDQSRRHGWRVKVDPNDTRLRHDASSGLSVVLVVEEPDRVRSGRKWIVLPGKPDTRPQREVGVPAAEAPENPSGLPVDFVDRPGGPARVQHVAVAVEV